MSRATIVLIVVVLAIVAAVIGLASVNTEVPVAPIEQAVQNDVAA
ncbi:hypothetical protein PQ455_11585 [Sphingomonas naphthae]|uniref:Uncharacterized protein n=1 Tax=Sphingomonas naphthae TaxID=1813468 RepID=A0ABY7TK80_9SPHN|nr:hypothetical protein [Sphingomonas naphthae]WCT72279.1 hypothetical protein PQ455_11585 [Sphingomonas naphthae]